MKTLCQKIIYSGRVQGVGFRNTTLRLTSGFLVTGTVRNLSDGDVELIVEGPEKDVIAFLARIEQQMSSFITQVEKHSMESQKFSDFKIIR